jgi:hypothetical protein
MMAHLYMEISGGGGGGLCDRAELLCQQKKKPLFYRPNRWLRTGTGTYRFCATERETSCFQPFG